MSSTNGASLPAMTGLFLKAIEDTFNDREEALLKAVGDVYRARMDTVEKMAERPPIIPPPVVNVEVDMMPVAKAIAALAASQDRTNETLSKILNAFTQQAPVQPPMVMVNPPAVEVAVDMAPVAEALDRMAGLVQKPAGKRELQIVHEDGSVSTVTEKVA